MPQNPTRQVHALLGKPDERKTRQLKKDTAAKLTKLLHMIQSLATAVFILHSAFEVLPNL